MSRHHKPSLYPLHHGLLGFQNTVTVGPLFFFQGSCLSHPQNRFRHQRSNLSRDGPTRGRPVRQDRGRQDLAGGQHQRGAQGPGRQDRLDLDGRAQDPHGQGNHSRHPG